MRSILLVLFSASLTSFAPQFTKNNLGCSCNGKLDSKGHGECRSDFEARAFCYVDPGTCSDQAASSAEGQWWTSGGEAVWEHHWWSYQACSHQEEFLSQAPTTVGGILNQYCWCEADEAPFINNFLRNSIQNQIVNQKPFCAVGEWMVCHRAVEEEEVDTAPLLEEPVCSCNGQWNNDRLGVQACESSFHGDDWCYVEPGRCPDEITSVRTGKSWSKDACKDQGDKWEWS